MQTGHQVSILLVDDDEIDVRATSRALRRSGIENRIDVAADGAEAIDMLRAGGTNALAWPYVIVLDLNMPRMNGIELLHAIRKDTVLADSVVIVLTTSDDESDKRAAYAAHVAAYFLKSHLDAAVNVITAYLRAVRFHSRAVHQRD